jgi:hypothetical protein
MKKIILSFMIVSNLLYAQQAGILGTDKELLIGVINEPENLSSITFILEAISPVWARDINDYTVPYLTTEYNLQSYTIPQIEMDKEIGVWDGFNACWHPAPAFGFGLYKLTVENRSANLRLDFRDENYGHYDPIQVPSESAQDIWVQYDYATNSFKWSTSANNIVWKSEAMKIWTAKGISSPSTDNFEPIAPPNFGISIINEVWPELSWDDFNQIVQNYQIHRCITDELDDPRNFSIITYVSGEYTSFIDYDVQNDGGVYAHYKVVAINSNFSAETEDITFTIVYPQPPTAPQNLQVRAFRDHPRLIWTANPEPDIDEYIIYIRENGGNWWVRGSASSTSTSYTDLLTSPSTPYDFLEYHIKAKNTYNLYSDMSNIVSVMGLTEKRVADDNYKASTITEISEYSISNFPNPFNPSTQIRYQLPENSFVNLIVYNSLGQEVAELVNQRQLSGKYSVQFKANGLPSGVYIYKLQAGEFFSVKKMILTK